MRFSFAISLFLLLFVKFSQLSAQNPIPKALSDKEIENFIDALVKEEIISEFGKDAILKGFQGKGNMFPTNRFGGTQKFNIPDSVMKSRAVIIGVVSIFEIMKNVGSAADELIQYRELTEKLLGESMLFKPEIEAEVSTQKPETFAGLEFDIRKIKNNYLNLTSKLLKIGLIDKKVHDEGIKWLEKDSYKLLKDFSYLVYLARQTWFYDNYENLKKEQIKFIDSLRIVKLLPEEKVKTLISSYKPFELKNKLEILSLCNQTLPISVEQGNFTRSELYENLFNQITNKLLPELKLSDLKITEIIKEKKENNLGAPMIANNPLSRFGSFDKNKQNFDLSLKINNLAYKQKADTDFGIVKKIKKEIPPDVNIDSTLIDTYANVFSSFLGFTNKDVQVINEYLADIHSDKRVFIMGNDFNPFNPAKNDKKMVMLLDSNQFKLFSKRDYNLIFAQQFKKTNHFSDKNSRDSLYAFIEDLQKNEILPVIHKDSVEHRIVRVRYNSEKDFALFTGKKYFKREFFIEFQESILQFNSSEKPSFAVFVNELKRVSKNRFNPDKISDNYATETAKSNKKDRVFSYSFRLNGKNFEEKQEVPKEDETNKLATGNTLIPSQIEWILLANKALEETKLDGKFYTISNSNNVLSMGVNITEPKQNIIYLTQKQFDFINKKYPEIFNDEKQENAVYENYQNTISTYSAEIFADSLKSNNLMALEAHEKLKKEVDLKKSKQPSDVLKYSKDAFVVDINDLAKKDNNLIYSELVEKINKQILPETKISNIEYQRKDSTENYQSFLISAKINDQKYEQMLYVSLQDEMKKALDSLKNPNAQYYPSIGENQFKIINDHLTDIKHPKRLVIVCDYRSPMLSFVFFDSTQAHIVAETLPNNYVDYRMYEQGFSKDSLLIKIGELENIGLVKSLSKAEKDSIIVLFRQELRTFNEIFEYFPSILADTPNNFDENFKQELWYKKLTENLIPISNGQFKPTNVSDNFSKMYKKGEKSDRKFVYGFMLNGKKYEDFQIAKGKSKKVDEENYSSGYFLFDESKVLNLINSALNENNIDGNYHQLNLGNIEEDEDWEIKYAFLTARQYRFLKEKYPTLFANFYDDNSADSDDIEEKDK